MSDVLKSGVVHVRRVKSGVLHVRRVEVWSSTCQTC